MEQNNGFKCHIKVLYLLSLCSLSGVIINLYFVYELSLRSPSCLQRNIETSVSDITKSGTEETSTIPAVSLRKIFKSPRIKRSVSSRYNRTYKPIPIVDFYPEPQPTADTDDYVWLTSVSRIKTTDLKEYCIEAKEYCPKSKPGLPGFPGIPGSKGEKGEKGNFQVGPKGDKGDEGKPGSSGSNGRDGRPGVPGLDGINGKHGFDGLPGIPGMPGANGTNGSKGQKGEMGMPGIPGPVGPPGLKGDKGSQGSMGPPGHPGIKAYKINNTEVHSLLIPPQMVDAEKFSTMVVEEGTKVVMMCKAVGTPAPAYVWKKEGNYGIHHRNRTFLSSANSENLTIDPVTRNHMATYICIAGNGLHPSASKEIQLNVHFPPLIKMKVHDIWANKGTTVRLECYVEANPSGIKYWLYGPDKKHINFDDKHYNVSSIVDGFHTTMILEIKNITEGDYGCSFYECVCKNEKGTATGIFSLLEGDTPILCPTKPSMDGKLPPIMQDESDCPKCVVDCPVITTKCDPQGKFNFALRNEEPINATMKELLGNRTNDCVPVQIGKPVFYREVESEWGTWMEDPLPNRFEHESSIWLTKEYQEDMQLLEFKNEADFKSNKVYRNYKLPHPFAGNGHIVYNGSLFYHAKGTNKIIKFNLSTNTSQNFSVNDLAFDGNNYLYSTKHNYVDIEADDNGLWIIYASTLSHNIILIKIDSYTLGILSKWNITTNREDTGEMFIVCGKLYTVQDVTDETTKIHGIFDLYENYYPGTILEFSNPFRQNYLIGYNWRREYIYTWDRGNLLTYPLKFS